MNAEQIVDGRRFRGVVIDVDRVEAIRWAFREYASGEWTEVSLCQALEAQGLRSRSGKKRQGVPLSVSRTHELLRNRYYIGKVSFRGVEYDGIHEPLIDEETFQQVQPVLASHAYGEKQREHPHYLKSTVYCGGCGQRLCITRAKGQYLYFFCIGRQKRRTHCLQRYVPADVLEEQVIQFYSRIQLTPQRIAEVRRALKAELASSERKQKRDADRSNKRLAELSTERSKLLQAHYADAIPLDLLKSEQQRIGRETEAAERGTTDVFVGREPEPAESDQAEGTRRQVGQPQAADQGQ